MGNGFDAVWFVYSNADLSSANVDCYSVAHKAIITDGLPSSLKFDNKYRLFVIFWGGAPVQWGGEASIDSYLSPC